MAYLEGDSGFWKALIPAAVIVGAAVMYIRFGLEMSLDEFANEQFGWDNTKEESHIRVLETERIAVNDEVYFPAFLKVAGPLTLVLASIIWGAPRVASMLRKRRSS